MYIFLFISIRILIWNLFSCLTGTFFKATLKQPDLHVSINMPFCFFEDLRGLRQVAENKDLLYVQGHWTCSPFETGKLSQWEGGTQEREYRSRPNLWRQITHSSVWGVFFTCPFFKTKFPPEIWAKLYRNLVYSRTLIDNYFFFFF